MTITLTDDQAIKVTQADLLAFERKLIRAARQRSEVEVNVRNERRGYILFGMWHADDDRTPKDFASGQIALILDGVAGIAAL